MTPATHPSAQSPGPAASRRSVHVGLVQALMSYARFTRLRLWRSPRRWLALLLLVTPIVATGALAATGRWGRDLYDRIVELDLRLWVLLLPALLLSDAVAEEVERRTVTFVYVRPAPRSALVLGKYLAVMGPLVGLFGLSLGASFAIALLVPPAGPSELWQELPALGLSFGFAALGLLSAGALAMLIGSRYLRHPLIAVALFFLVSEGLFGSLGSSRLALVSLGWHLRNLAGLGAGAPLVAAWVSAAVLLGVTGLGVGGTIWRVSALESPGD